MHIAILSDSGNSHTQKWARALQLAGARVTVLGFGSDCPEGMDCVQVAPPLGKKGSWSYADYLLGGKKLAAALDELEIDIVNALNLTPFGVWAVRAGRRPLIASALGADVLEYPPRPELSPLLRHRSWDNVEGEKGGGDRLIQKWKRRFYRKRVAEVLDFADMITGDNQHLLDCMENWFGVAPGRMRLLRWGVEPELFEMDRKAAAEIEQRFELKPGQRVILSPRGAKAIYQGDVIIEAMEKLLATGNYAQKFVMLGAGYSVAQAVERKAKELSSRYENFIFIPGQLPRELIYRLWNYVDVFVSAPIYDGYSAAVAEGRWAGAIPVVNDTPATQEIIRHGENGWVVKDFTPEQLAEGLREVLANFASLGPRFATANRKWVEVHSRMDRSAELFLKWCKDLKEK